MAHVVVVVGGLLIGACASAPPVVEAPRAPASAGRCVVQDAQRSSAGVVVDGPRGWLIAQGRQEADGVVELVAADTRMTLARVALSLEGAPTMVQAMPDPGARVLCVRRTTLGPKPARTVGVWDLARATWRWSAPTDESGYVLAADDRCFFSEGTSLVARGFDDGAELARAPLGGPRDPMRVTRGGPPDAPRLLVEQREPAGRPEGQVHALHDARTGALVAWFAARCADLDATGRVTVVWPEQADAPRAAARAQAERILGARLVVAPACAPVPRYDELPVSPRAGRVAWPWQIVGERVVAHVAEGLFVWDWARGAPARVTPTAPVEPRDANGEAHPLAPAVAPDGAWVGIVGDAARLDRWALDAPGFAALDPLPLPSEPGHDAARDAAWQVSIGPARAEAGGYPIAVLRSGARGRTLYVGDAAHPDRWRRVGGARLYDGLWPDIVWPAATPDVLVVAEPHFGPQAVSVAGEVLGRFAPRATMSRVRPLLVAGDRVVVGVEPSGGLGDAGVYTLALPRLEVSARTPWVAPPGILGAGRGTAAVWRRDGSLVVAGPVVGSAAVRWTQVAPHADAPAPRLLVAHPQRDAYDLYAADGARVATLGLIGGAGWVEHPDGRAVCAGAACARYLRVTPDGSSTAVTAPGCVLE